MPHPWPPAPLPPGPWQTVQDVLDELRQRLEDPPAAVNAGETGAVGRGTPSSPPHLRLLEGDE